jgi:transposase
VAKAPLDIALRPTGARWAVTNAAPGMAARVAWLQAAQPTLIVLEATGGSHRAVVAALAAAALSLVAVRYHPVRNAFSQRLCTAGKAKKVALTACMRTLLTMLHAMGKHQKPWQGQEVPSA